MTETGKPVLQTRLRMEEAEDLLSSGVTAKRARSILSKRWGVSSRQASRVIRRVFEQWAIESAATRDAKRVQMRARLQMMWRRAMAKQGYAMTKDGELLSHEDPDINGAARVAELECRLDGLLEQDGSATNNVIVAGGDLNMDIKVLEIMQRHYGLAERREDQGEGDA